MADTPIRKSRGTSTQFPRHGETVLKACQTSELALEHIASIRRSLQLLVLISLFVTAYFAKDLILPILLGFLLALTLSPVVRAMFRIGIPYAVSAFLLVFGTAMVILAVVLLSAGTVASWSNEIPQMGQEIKQLS